MIACENCAGLGHTDRGTTICGLCRGTGHMPVNQSDFERGWRAALEVVRDMQRESAQGGRAAARTLEQCGNRIVTLCDGKS